jgi:hypothetical protein
MTVEALRTADADIDDIVQSLASACLGIDAARIPSDSAVDLGSGELMTATIAITGAWHGAVAVSCSPHLARRVGSAMFGTADLVSDEEARDALREIVNIIGGNFKSLVSGPARLSLPTVGDGEGYWADALPVHRLHFDCGGEVLVVSVLAVATGQDPNGPADPGA